MNIDKEIEIEKRLMELAEELKTLTEEIKMSIHLDTGIYQGEAYTMLYLHTEHAMVSRDDANYLGVIREAENAEKEAI